jgi:hypothetical protein
MYAIKRSRAARGMVFILVLVLIALLLIISLAIIAGTNVSSQAATAVSIKYRVLNSAEGAENVALDAVASDPSIKSDTHLTGTLNGISYDAWIVANNILGKTPMQATDPATGKLIWVPQKAAFLYGTGAENGGHTVFVEAVAVPVSPLTLPQGVMNAGNDILDMTSAPINSSGVLLQNDANMHAVRDINIFGAPSPVQGDTFAGRTDNLPGIHGTNSNQGSDVVLFPSGPQISEAARTARMSALTGSLVDGTQIPSGSTTYTGNVYVSGNMLVHTGSTVTFSQGTYVYVNGNLCVDAGGAVANTNTGSTEFVVAGNVEIKSTGSYTALAGQNSLMLALGLDSSPADPNKVCSGNNSHAVDFDVNNGPIATSIGTIYAPYGSIDLTGPGSFVGAVDAGTDVLFEISDPKSVMQYDAAQASTTLNTGTLTYSSYIEY